MVATHPDFKSMEPNIQDAETMKFHLGDALAYEQKFVRWVPPWELSQWGDGELERFQVQLDQVNRLYDMLPNGENDCEREFRMLARMNYEGRHVFINFQGSFCGYFGSSCQDYGIIFISNDGETFMRSFRSENEDLVLKSLAEDGIFITPPTDYDHVFNKKYWKSVPNLEYLCHQNIYENQTKLKNYAKMMPKMIKESIDAFIKEKSNRKFFYSILYDENDN